ncbi:MAG: hydantoinase/oxoprolinase family protein, partial [Desulfobacterales bacterium]|nr:hydantoinase/oxoprolinase family protein [Desulfobacterales bacterium]
IPLADRVEELVHAQMVAEIGFTPTDALHALGLLEIGNRTRAIRGAEVLAAGAGCDTETFCRRTLAAVEGKIEENLLGHVLRKEIGASMSGSLPGLRKSAMLSVNFTLNIPIVGIGAAARHLLPGVSQRLNTEVVFPDHFEVGNALGAILMAAGQ